MENRRADRQAGQMKSNCPYWIIATAGRLPCPIAHKGTVIERQFKTGRFGGKRHKEETITDQRRALQMFHQPQHCGLKPEVCVVAERNRARPGAGSLPRVSIPI
jgi:hypothetical protein